MLEQIESEVVCLSPVCQLLAPLPTGFLSRSFTEKWIPSVIISHRYKAQDTPARRTFEQALTGAFMSAVIKDLRPSALPFVASLIRHYTMVAVAQQCGEELFQQSRCMQTDPHPPHQVFLSRSDYESFAF